MQSGKLGRSYGKFLKILFRKKSGSPITQLSIQYYNKEVQSRVILISTSTIVQSEYSTKSVLFKLLMSET